MGGHVVQQGSENQVWSFFQCPKEFQEAVRDSALPFDFRECLVIPSCENLTEHFHSASKIEHKNKEYHICMPDYHVDDLFNSENSTLSRDEKSKLTSALEKQLKELKLELNEISACENGGPLQSRAAFPEIIVRKAA